MEVLRNRKCNSRTHEGRVSPIFRGGPMTSKGIPDHAPGLVEILPIAWPCKNSETLQIRQKPCPLGSSSTMCATTI